MQEITAAHEFYQYTQHIKGPKTFLIDVDHTLIWPVSLTLRTCQHHRMIDDIKKSITDTALYEEIIGQWRTQRKVALTDKQWPLILEKIKKQSEIYGLTQVETGSFGPIPSIEKWRMDELTKFNIRFSHNEKMEYIHPEKGPSCHKGCIMAGKKTKSQALVSFFGHFKQSPQSIIMLDDKIEQLKSIRHFCKKKKIDFFAFHWKAPLVQSNPLIDSLAKKQKKYLIKNYSWIES